MSPRLAIFRFTLSSLLVSGVALAACVATSPPDTGTAETVDSEEGNEDAEADAGEVDFPPGAIGREPTLVIPEPLPPDEEPIAGAPIAHESTVSPIPADPSDPEPVGSTGSNTWDLITTADPSVFVCVSALGTDTVELALDGYGSGYALTSDVHVFTAEFRDGTWVDLVVDPRVGDAAAAEAEIQRYLTPLGQLPTVLRQGIGRLAIVVGDDAAMASTGEGISVYTENMDVRQSDNRLEETLFHESVHASLDRYWSYEESQAWLNAQVEDGRYLTEYSRESPRGEDLAESALYIYAATFTPDRFPDGMSDAVLQRIPNRAELIQNVIFAEPLVAPDVSPTPACT